MGATIGEDQLHALALERALALPAAHLERPFGSGGAEVMKVLGKMFLLATELKGRPILVLKADPRRRPDASRERRRHQPPATT